ncbi:MAG: LemA family protein [Bacteroidia bacterium]|jgi:LemA protein|nr:LemA family protein [Bacteroidia bacterium]
MKNLLNLVALFGITVLFSSCWPPNTIVDKEESVNETWANVQSSYQRRLDLVDNLVNTVKGAAQFEKETFTSITKARAGIQEPSEAMLADKEALATFYASQKQLQSQARMVFNLSVENYPELKATDAFRDFQAQLEGIENRINTARTKYNGSVKGYNSYIQKIPGSWFASEKEKRDYFDADSGSEKAPKVKF